MTEISIFDLDDSFQIRFSSNDEKVDEYAEIMLDAGGWGPFPPLDVVLIGGKYKIADGIHRFNAAKAVGLEMVPCNVTVGTSLDLLTGAYAKNRLQGLGWPQRDRKHGLRIALEMYSAGELGNATQKTLHDITGESERTIGRRIKEMEEEGWTFPETSIGADGRERPTKYKKSTPANAEVEKPPQTSPARPTVPTDGAPNPLFCQNPDCGTPIWPENIGNQDYTYCELNGKWFCCPECLDEYQSAQRSAAATDLTGIPETLPPTPSAALPTRPNPSLEPSHPAQPVDPIEEEVKPRETHKQSVVLEIGFQCEVDGTVDFDEAMTILKEELPRLTAGSRVKISKNFDVINININNILNNNLKQQNFREEKTRFKFKLSGGKVFYLGTAQFEDWKQAYPMLDMEVVMQDCMRWNNQGSGSGLVPFQKLYQRIESFLINQRDKARPQNKPRRQVDETAFTTQEGYE